MSQRDPNLEGGNRESLEVSPPEASAQAEALGVAAGSGAAPPSAADPRGRQNPALRATGFSGVSRGVTLTQWLELVEVGRRDAHIRLRDKSGNEGRIWCRAGEIVDAESGPLQGDQAVQSILASESGEVSIEFAPCNRPRAITTPTFALLWEGAHRKRHASESNDLKRPERGPRTLASRPPEASAPRPQVPAVLRSTLSHASVPASIRPHTASIHYPPSRSGAPPGSAEFGAWSQERALGLALAFVGGLMGVWLLSRIPPSSAPAFGQQAPGASVASPAQRTFSAEPARQGAELTALPELQSAASVVVATPRDTAPRSIAPRDTRPRQVEPTRSEPGTRPKRPLVAATPAAASTSPAAGAATRPAPPTPSAATRPSAPPPLAKEAATAAAGAALVATPYAAWRARDAAARAESEAGKKPQPGARPSEARPVPPLDGDSTRPRVRIVD